MVDCGVPYKRLEKELKRVKILLITHTHGDHLNVKTYETIKRRHPHIVTLGNYDVAYHVNLDKIVANSPITAKGYEIYSFDLFHDVPCTGFAWEWEGKNVIYATDTWSLENAPDWKYDYFFIESNHDERKVAMIDDSKYGYKAKEGSLRHLSTQKAREFYFVNRRDRWAEFVELHKSERFY